MRWCRSCLSCLHMSISEYQGTKAEVLRLSGRVVSAVWNSPSLTTCISKTGPRYEQTSLEGTRICSKLPVSLPSIRPLYALSFNAWFVHRQAKMKKAYPHIVVAAGMRIPFDGLLVTTILECWLMSWLILSITSGNITETQDAGFYINL